MAWDPLPKRAASAFEEYSGDAPMDAFGGALGHIAADCTDRIGRMPTVAELVTALTAALGDAPASEVDTALAAWRAASATAKPGPKRQRPKLGDVVAIPYAGDGTTAVYGWLVFVPGKDLPSPGLGVCLVVFDRDVGPSDDLTEVVRAPLLLGPIHPGDHELREGEWKIVGNVAGDFAALLPRFAVQVRKGEHWAHVVRDYAGEEVEDTPANRARVREMSVGGAGSLPLAIRALRGHGRWLEGFDPWLANGVRRPS